MRKVVSLRDLKIGDILEEDIKDSDEVVLITRGTVLTERILNRLRKWSMDKEQLITIDDGSEHYNPHDREEIKEKSLKYLKDVITSDEEEAKPSIDKLTEMIGIMAQELEDITTIPADILKIEDAYQGEHYYRVARIAMALTSIYNSEVSEDEKVSLQSVGLAAFLHDYGKKFTRASDKNSRLAIIGNECAKLDELSGSNTSKTHNAYAYIALKDKTEEVTEQKKNSNNSYVQEELRSDYESLSDDNTILEILDEDSQEEDEKTQMLEEKRPISKRISSLFGVRR